MKRTKADIRRDITGTARRCNAALSKCRSSGDFMVLHRTVRALAARLLTEANYRKPSPSGLPEAMKTDSIL